MNWVDLVRRLPLQYRDDNDRRYYTDVDNEYDTDDDDYRRMLDRADDYTDAPR